MTRNTRLYESEQAIRRTVYIVDDGNGNYFLYSFLIPEDKNYVAVPLISRDGGKTYQIDDTAKYAEIARLDQLVCDFQAASGLEGSSGDPGSITPDHVATEIGLLNEQNRALVEGGNAALAERDELREQLAAKGAENASLREQVATLTRERDEARAEARQLGLEKVGVWTREKLDELRGEIGKENASLRARLEAAEKVVVAAKAASLLVEYAPCHCRELAQDGKTCLNCNLKERLRSALAALNAPFGGDDLRVREFP